MNDIFNNETSDPKALESTDVHNPASQDKPDPDTTSQDKPDPESPLS